MMPKRCMIVLMILFKTGISENMYYLNNFFFKNKNYTQRTKTERYEA